MPLIHRPLSSGAGNVTGPDTDRSESERGFGSGGKFRVGGDRLRGQADVK